MLLRSWLQRKLNLTLLDKKQNVGREGAQLRAETMRIE